MRPCRLSGHLLVRGLPWYSPDVNQTYYINGDLSAKEEYDVRLYIHYASRIQSWMSSHRESRVRPGLIWSGLVEPAQPGDCPALGSHRSLPNGTDSTWSQGLIIPPCKLHFC